jgi:hypothetical protein
MNPGRSSIEVFIAAATNQTATACQLLGWQDQRWGNV